MADDHEQEDTAVVEEEYAVWKKNTPFLYDLIISHPLEWPSLTVHWVPSAPQPYSDPSLAVHKLILGTHTSDDYPNYLMVADALLPASQPNVDAVSDEPTLPKVEISQKIRVDGEVNRARCMLQKPNMVGAKTSGSEVYVFDCTKQGLKSQDGECDPDLRLRGHDKEGYGLSWSPFKEGYLLSGSNDCKICLWDVSALAQDRVLHPMHVYESHESVVNDVSWHSKDENLFGSVGDDCQLMIWDFRTNPAQQTVKVHEKEVNYLSFHPCNEWVLATASSDTTVGLFDMRKLNVPLHALSGHTEEVFQVEWDPNHDTVLASYAGDRRLIVCDTSDGRSYAENTRVTEVETYSIASWHGTTVLWVELPTGELLVGVDSQAAAIYTAPPGSEFKDFVGLMSQTEQKFVQIIKGIFATLAGGAKRCDDMVLYARKQMLDYMVKGGNVTIDDVTCAASHFFHELSPLKEVEKDIPSTVHIACWMPEEHKYKVIEVGDIIPTQQVQSTVFGSGSGSVECLEELGLMTTPISVETVKDKLVEASLKDPHTGGVHRVFSLEGGICKCKHEGTILNELENRKHSEVLFDGKSMFVVIRRENEDILSQNNLVLLLDRFNAHVFWLCVVDEFFLVYRVVLQSASCCKTWSESCEKFYEVWRQTYTSENGSCHYYLFDATKHSIDFIRMEMWKDNFWKENLKFNRF